jgi:hypothetical protein
MTSANIRRPKKLWYIILYWQRIPKVQRKRLFKRYAIRETQSHQLQFVLFQGLAQKYECKTTKLLQGYEIALANAEDAKWAEYNLRTLRTQRDCSPVVEKEVNKWVDSVLQP